MAADVLFAPVAGQLCAISLEQCDRTPFEAVDGTRKAAKVSIDGADAVPLAGDPDAIEVVRDRLLVAAAVDGLGAASRALEMAVGYAGEREQFGRPIGSFQAVQHLCADMLIDIEIGRAACYYALWAGAAADPRERRRAALMAKAWASDAFFRVGAACIQVHGGIGFTWEHDAHLPYKRLLTLQHRLGGSSDQLAELADLVFPR
jgi:alkylation response protein AidB-like acyl-CoA dehydrogenase